PPERWSEIQRKGETALYEVFRLYEYDRYDSGLRIGFVVTKGAKREWFRTYNEAAAFGGFQKLEEITDTKKSIIAKVREIIKKTFTSTEGVERKESAGENK